MNRAAKAFIDKVLGPQWPDGTSVGFKFLGRYKNMDVYATFSGKTLLTYYARGQHSWVRTYDVWPGDLLPKKPIPGWVKPFL